jgi:hypothetical protein
MENHNIKNMSKKRLLKDLPFDHLKKGAVVDDVSQYHYHIHRGSTFYGNFSSSDNGVTTFSDEINEILDLVWNNPDWFEPATLEKIEITRTDGGILLKFQPISEDDKECLMQGLVSLLSDLENHPNKTWSKFKNLVPTIK